MKKFYKILTMALILTVSVNILKAVNDEPLPRKVQNYKQPTCLGVVGNYDVFSPKVSNNKILAEELVWYKIDSLANSLSYHSRNTTPFVYSAKYNLLGTIKRGDKNPDEEGVNETNTKNNLFVRLSTDLGKSWSKPDVVYDEFKYKYGGGRYPTMNFFEFENDIHVAWTASLVNEAAGEWKGYVLGLSSESLGTELQLSEKCMDGASPYEWGVADGSVAGYEKGSAFVLYGINGVTPMGGSLTDNGNIGYRFSEDLLPIKTVIPDQWRSSIFNPVDTVATVPKELIGIRFRKNGDWYLGVNGNFVTNPNVQAAKLGFSISTDKGQTWGEFIINPPNLFKDYGASLGLDPEFSYIGYQSKDFTVMENGDIWSVVLFIEGDTNKAYADRKFQVLAVKYENDTKNWSITKLADVQGLWVNFLNDQGQTVASASDIELEISKTVDEKHLVVKWLDLIGVNWVDADSYQYQTNDMFMAVYDNITGMWYPAQNLTNDNLLIRDTHMPEELPNDLTNIPIMGLHTIVDDSENYNTAFRQYLRKQWILLASVNASQVLTVEEQQVLPEFVNLYPNPASNETMLSFNATGTNTKVFITDALGKIVATIYDDMLSDGMHSININTANLISGTYFINILSNNKIQTRILNVIK